MFLGITGRIKAGKDTLIKILAKYDIKTYSFKPALMAEVERRGLRIDREVLQQVGFDYRDEMAIATLERIFRENGGLRGNFAIETIRSPEQASIVGETAGSNNFYFVGINASRGLRYKRTLSDGRLGDPDSWKTFVEADEKDWKGYQMGNGQNVRGCFALVHEVIENNGTLKDFEIRIDDLMSSLGIRRKVI